MKRAGRSAVSFASIFGGLALWQGGVIDEFYVSRPTDVAARLYSDLFVTGAILPDIQATLTAVLAGYGIGVGGGIAIAYAVHRFKLLQLVVEPWLTAIQGVPKTAIAPLFIIWLGIGIWSKIVVAASLVLFITYHNTRLGLRMVRQDYLDLVRVMGASERQALFDVVVPSATPFVLTALRAAVPYAVIGVVVGEFVAARRGIGIYILRASAQFDATGTFVGVVVLLVIVLAGTLAVGAVERRLSRWSTMADGSAVPGV